MRPYREAEVLTELGCSPGAPAVASSFPNKTFPPAVAGAIERPRLLEKLARVPQVALTTVVAGAGYGKTTLLAQWLNLFCCGEPNTVAGHPAKPQRGEDPLTFPASSNPVAGHPAKPVSGRFFWYQLDERDSDPSFLIKNLLAATYPDRPFVETVVRGLNSPKIDWERITSIILSAFAAETIRPAQSSGRPVKASRDPAEALVARPGDAHRAPVFLILDDFHSVERSKAVVDFLSALLRNRPPWLHLLLASRSRPPLALSRMRARGEVLEISEADLGFTREEVEEWLNRFQEQTRGGLAPEGDLVESRVNFRVAEKEHPAGTRAHQAAPALEQLEPRAQVGDKEQPAGTCGHQVAPVLEQLEPRAQVGDKEQPAGGRGGLMEMAGLARRLAEVSEGWAAGINLLFSSLAGKGPEEMRVFWNDVAFHGGGTFDFLAEEVFAQQSPRVKEFLVRTAILEVVSPESGDWLMDRYGETLGPPAPGWGGPAATREREGGLPGKRKEGGTEFGDIREREGRPPGTPERASAILRYLVEKGLFTTQLVGRQALYRYHYLFRHFLREKLREVYGAAAEKELGRQAGRFLLERGETEEAIGLLIKAGEWEALAGIIAREGMTRVKAGQSQTVGHWLRQLPSSLVRGRPDLLLVEGALEESRGNWERAERLFAQAVRLAENPTGETQSLLVTALHRLAQLLVQRSRSQEAIALCEKAQSLLTAENYQERAELAKVLTRAYWYTQQWPESQNRAEEALRLYRLAGDRMGEAKMLNDLAGVFYEPQGQLERALLFFEEARRLHQELGNLEDASISLANSGLIYHMKREYGGAIPILLRAIELAERIFFKRGLALATLFLGEAYTEIGDFQRAAEYLARAEILQEQLGEPVRKAGIYYGWSVLKRYQGLYQAAEELARKDLAIVEGLKNKHVIAQALNNLGYALYAGGRLTQAEETWRQAEDCYGDWPSHYELARIKMGLALVYWARLKRGQDDGEGGHSTVPAAVTSEARLPTDRNDSEGGGGLTEDKPPVPSSLLARVSSGQGEIQAENLKQALLEKLKRTLQELFDLIRDHGYGFFLRIPPNDRRLPGDEYIEEVLAAARALNFEPSSGELRTDKPLPARSSTDSEARGKALLFAQDREPTRPGAPSGLTVTAQVADRQNESADRYPRGPLSGLATRPAAEVQLNDPRVTHLDAASGGMAVKSYAAPPLEVYALGRFQVLRGKREITARDWQKEKTKTLLKYLLVNLGRKLPVEVILETLWPEMEPKAARQNLAVIMHYLRRALEPGLARGEESSYCLRHPQSIELKGELIWLDARDFAAKFEAGRKAQQEGKAEEASTLFQEAERLYQGDFLPEEAYEDWAIPERERLREMYLSLLGYLARYCGKSGEYQLGEDYCRRVLQIDPLREEVHRLLIELLARAGRRNEALRQYLSCREILQRELRVEPMPLTRELYQKLVEGKEI